MKQEIRTKLEWMGAVSCGTPTYSKRDYIKNGWINKPFKELKYFFNKKGLEVGHIFMEDTQWEALCIFKVPRVWYSSFKENLIMEKNWS